MINQNPISKKKNNYHLEFLQELFPWADNKTLQDFSKTRDKNLFQKIWDPDKFDWKRFSPILFSSFLDYLEIWWNPEKISWTKCTEVLSDVILTLYSKYNIVIRPEWFNKYNPLILNIFDFLMTRRALTFSDFWDPDKVDWNDPETISFLFERFSDTHHFKIWWDPEKFNWKNFSHYLPEYVPDKFDIWWDPEKFVFNSESVIELCSWVKQYQDWFIPNKVKILSDSIFRQYVTQSSLIPFEEWYDPKYDFDKHLLIRRGKQEEFDIWFPNVKHDLDFNDLRLLIKNFPKKYNVWIEVFEDRWKDIPPSLKLRLIQFDENKWKERFRYDCKNRPNILEKDLTFEELRYIIVNHADLIFDLFSDLEIFLKEKHNTILPPTILMILLEKYRKERFDVFKKVLKYVARSFFGYYIDYLLKIGMKELWMEDLKEYIEKLDEVTSLDFIMLCKTMELDHDLFRELISNTRTKIGFTKCLMNLPLREISLTSVEHEPVKSFERGIISFGKENIDVWWDPNIVTICYQSLMTRQVIKPEFFEIICKNFPDPEVVKKILFFEFKERSSGIDLSFESRTKYIHYILKYIDIFSDREILEYIRKSFNFYNIFTDIPIEKIKAIRTLDLFERTNLWND